MSQVRVSGSGRHPAVQLSRVRSRSRSRLLGDSECACLGVEGRMSNDGMHLHTYLVPTP